MSSLIPAAVIVGLVLATNSAPAMEKPVSGSVGLTATGDQSLSMFQDPLLVTGVYSAFSDLYQRNPRGEQEELVAICSKTVACPPTCSNTCPKSCATTCSIQTCGATCAETCAGETCSEPYNTCKITVNTVPSDDTDNSNSFD
jgi:hypothetical protein